MDDPTNEFERLSQEPSPSLAREFWQFLGETRKWWLMPILGAVLLLTVLVLLAATPLAPFIYTLF